MADENYTKSVWDKRYAEGELACTRKIIECDPVDYTQHPFLYKHAVAKRLCGDVDGNPLEVVSKKYLSPAPDSVLSLGAGLAFAEEWLVSNGYAKHVTAYEQSSVAVATAKARFRELGLDGTIDMRCGDVRMDGLSPGSFDVVFVQAAIHHFYDIDDMFALMHGLLRPNGLLIYDEYVGPDHHMYEREVMDLLDVLNECLEGKYRWDHVRNQYRDTMPRTTMEYMMATDPSEGVHASRILPLTYKYFDVDYRKDYGGTLMRPFWVGVLPNFDFDNPSDQTIAKLIIQVENLLTQYGVIPHYHTRVVAKRRDEPLPDLTAAQVHRINYSDWNSQDRLARNSSCQPAPVVPQSVMPCKCSDENWLNGVARSWAAAFFVDNYGDAQDALLPGRRLKFADGSVRTIVETRLNESSLIVFVDGDPLDGTEVGYPNNIDIFS